MKAIKTMLRRPGSADGRPRSAGPRRPRSSRRRRPKSSGLGSAAPPRPNVMPEFSDDDEVGYQSIGDAAVVPHEQDDGGYGDQLADGSSTCHPPNSGLHFLAWCPGDIVCEVHTFLGARSLARSSMVCREFRDAAARASVRVFNDNFGAKPPRGVSLPRLFSLVDQVHVVQAMRKLHWQSYSLVCL